MQPHNGHGPDERKPETIDTSLGYEASDVKVTGIVVFLTSMAIFIGVIGLVAYGLGKVMDKLMAKEDGPTSRWSKTVDVRELGNLPSSPALQNKMAQLVQDFPTPRLQLDDGNQDVANLHKREDLLLNNYSWVDQSKGVVRIPIERAMELVAQQGLPVAPAVQTQAPMTGDSVPTVTMPLTNGFARTGFEQEEAYQQAAAAKRQ